MRDKFLKFMNGRNGMDELGRAESWMVMALLIVTMFSRSLILNILTIALFVHMYFRVFSKNVSKRYEENQKFVNFRYNNTVKWNNRRKYKYFKCPLCKQKVRVPRGHGKICVTCPKCREEFIRRS